MKRILCLLLFIGMALSIVGCAPATKTFTIVSGSENESLEPLLEKFEKANNVDIVMVYQGSVDIMNLLSTDGINDYQAVWPANGLWISIGDSQKKIRNAQSIMTSPIVFGIKKSLAEDLGWVGKEVVTADILTAIQQEKLKFMMTSATQSNSGACAYLGFLSALLHNPETITMADLDRPELRKDMTQLLSGVERSSGSSGWLKDLFLKGGYDAMVNYEALIIETNQELERMGQEPLYVVYPVDGLSIADSPLGYVDNGDQEMADTFAELQKYLLSEPVQKQIAQTGRRTGIAGVSSSADSSIFRAEWGIDISRSLSGITIPTAEVINKALLLYQTELRKPSFTVFCLDYSGSMSGSGEAELKEAMKVLLTQELASKYLLQASEKDLIFVIPFSHQVLDVWQVAGNKQEDLNVVLDKINQLVADGGTDIYSPSLQGIEILMNDRKNEYSKAVVLLTDGESNEGLSMSDFERAFNQFNVDIPVYAIMFGKASKTQLEGMTELTRGRVFDGKTNLIEAFKKAKGYN